MEVPLAGFLFGLPAVEPAARSTTPRAAGSLMLRRMDRRGTKSGTGAPLRVVS